MKLNLGCGLFKMNGYVNIDSNPSCKPDKVMDIEKRWAFKDNSIDEVVADRVLEHCKDVPFVMSEIWRVCKPNSIVRITVPRWNGDNAFTDPTHKTFFTEHTFDYFSKKRGSSCQYFNCFIQKIAKRLHLYKLISNTVGDITAILRVVK